MPDARTPLAGYPSDWATISLAAARPRARGTIDPLAFPEEFFEYYSIPAFQGGGGPVVSAGKEILSTKQLVVNGTILFGKLNPRVPKVWRVEARTAYRKLASTEFLSLVPTGALDGGFLYYLARSALVMSVAETMVAGSTPSRQRVDPSAFYDIEVPCPPLREQEAIAGVLAKIQRAVEVEDQRIAALKELKAATMAKVFREGLNGEPLKQTEIGEIPQSWHLAPIGQFAEIGNGSTPNRSNGAYWDDGSLPWITSTKVHEVFIEAADEFVTQQARDKCHLPLVKRGSLVVAITGQGKTLGNVAMLLLDTCINQHLAFIRLKDDEVLAEFLLFFLQSQYANLRSASQGGGTTKGALTCGFLRQYPIPVPPLGEQAAIAGLVKAILERLVTGERRRDLLEALFKSALDQLMTGQLRVTPLLKEDEAADA